MVIICDGDTSPFNAIQSETKVGCVDDDDDDD
jgi:hypothetical protein